MSKTAEKPLTLEDATTEQPESNDPEYLAWVHEQIRRGREDLKDPAKRHSEQEVWKSLGLKD
jgi:hypothetical protein